MKTCSVFVQFELFLDVHCELVWKRIAVTEATHSVLVGSCTLWKPEKQIDLAEMNLFYSGCFKGIPSLWIVLPEQPLYEQSFSVKSSFHRKGKYP